MELQSSSQIVTTNTQLSTGRMPFLSPNQQCQSTEGKPTEIDQEFNYVFACQKTSG